MSCDDPDGFPIHSDNAPKKTATFYVKQFHGWESLQDWDRDLSEAINDLPVPAGNFEGTITVVMTYTERDEAE